MDSALYLEECLNHIIKNEYNQAYEKYINYYYKKPDKIIFLFGALICSIMQGKIKYFCDNIFQKESKVSLESNRIKIINEFIANNFYFENFNKETIVLNIGIFLRNNNCYEDAYLFFKVCLILMPDNNKALTLTAEYLIINNKFHEGFGKYLNAVKQFKKK